MAYVILARGDGRIFLLTESLSAITCLTLNIVAYTYWGLNGLGVAYVVWYLIYMLIVGIIYRFRYNLSLGKGVLRLALLSTFVALISIVGYFVLGWYIPAAIGTIFIPIAIKRILRKK